MTGRASLALLVVAVVAAPRVAGGQAAPPPGAAPPPRAAGPLLPRSAAPPLRRVAPRPRPHPAPSAAQTRRQRREAALETVVTAPVRVEEPLADSTLRKEVIGRGTLEERGARTVADALEGHLGAQVGSQPYYQRGAPTGIQLQGCDARRLLLLRDGRRLIGETDGIVDAANLPLHDAARVEILKGAVSALYGADALCGVVNVISRDPPKRGVRLGWEAEYGRYHAYTARLTLGARITERLAVEWSSTARGRAGFDLDPTTAGTDGDAVRAVEGRLRLLYQPLDPLRLNLEVGYGLERRDRVLAEAFPMMPRQQVYRAPWLLQRPEVALSAEWAFSRVDRLTLRVYDHFFWADARRQEVAGDSRRSRITIHNYVSASLVGRMLLGRFHRLTAGGELGHERLTLRRRQVSAGSGGEVEELRVAEVPGRSVRTEALFLQDELTPWTWLTVVAGLRYTHHGGFGHHVTPRLSLLVEPRSWLRLRASYGQGFRAPTLKDLYLVFDHSELGVPLVIRGNPDLRAETAQDLRASVEVRPWPRVLLHGGGFFTDYRDLIEESLPEFVEDHFEISRTNVGRARTYGLEAGFAASFLRHFRASGGYVLLYGENLERREPLPNRPRHQAQLALRFHHRRWGTRIALWGRWQSALRMQSPLCGSEPVTTPGYPLLHATVEQRVWRGIRLTLRGQNLTHTLRSGSNLCDLRPQPGWMLFGGVRGELSFP